MSARTWCSHTSVHYMPSTGFSCQSVLLTHQQSLCKQRTRFKHTHAHTQTEEHTSVSLWAFMFFISACHFWRHTRNDKADYLRGPINPVIKVKVTRRSISPPLPRCCPAENSTCLHPYQLSECMCLAVYCWVHVYGSVWLPPHSSEFGWNFLTFPSM